MERWVDEDEPRDFRRENPSSGAEAIEPADGEEYCEIAGDWFPPGEMTDCVFCAVRYHRDQLHLCRDAQEGSCPDGPAS